MPVCNVCDAHFQGSTCRCGATAVMTVDGREERTEPTVNYCEWEQCGIPCSIGSTKDFHLSRYCPWHRMIDRLEPQNRAEGNTFEAFQLWRKSRVTHSPISDQTVWEAMQGARKLTYRPVKR